MKLWGNPLARNTIHNRTMWLGFSKFLSFGQGEKKLPLDRSKWQDEFFGLYDSHIPTSSSQKLLLAANAALASLRDPERADQVAALGDTTVRPLPCVAAEQRTLLIASDFFSGLLCPPKNSRTDAKRPRWKIGAFHRTLTNPLEDSSPIPGPNTVPTIRRQILRDRPVITEERLDLPRLRALPPDTFGRSYAEFMDSRVRPHPSSNLAP